MTISRVSGSTLGGIPAWGAFSGSSTGTYTSGSISYAYRTFTSSSTITISRAGWFDFLCVAGGGGGGSGNSAGGGAGGMIDSTQTNGVPVYFPVGTFTITVGAAAGIQGRGNDSTIGVTGITAVGGGPANTYAIRGGSGGGGGGGSPGEGVLYQGTNGQTNNGGGAGSKASGLAHVSVAGLASSIAGSTPTTTYTAGSFTFSVGGTAGSGASGAANTGNGGNGTNTGGGSGIVIIRMRTS